MRMSWRSMLGWAGAGLWAGAAALIGPGGISVAAAADLPPRVAPSDAAARIKVPEGFHVVLAAAEPDIVQPIAMTIDARGRLWVVENYSYPIWMGGPQGKDRILIFEDADGDGRLERRTVFYEGGTSFTGIEVGFGGVWVCATPNLLFIPDRNGDDKPDGAPVVKLDGWDVNARHNMFNGLRWGPDGWLWGCNGILSNSMVGAPGTPAEKRTPINCGVWRYHPTRKVFEVVAHGTTNPWGLDFNARGEAFITNCVIAHLFHVVPGARFERMFGNDFNTHSYALMETCADHLHWAGGRWQDSRSGEQHSVLGGGHAHVGCMIYLGDNWPSRYHDTLFTCNIHGHRVNNDRLERGEDGTEIVARHSADFLSSSDPWFRGMELKYGPDGGVFLTDWSDVGECHEQDDDNAHRENGRIFKITYGDVKPHKVDLERQSSEELARLQLHSNAWHTRTARRLLQERAAAGQDLGAAHRALYDMLKSSSDECVKLRAIWALYVSGGLDENDRLALLDDPSGPVRVWGVRLLVDEGRASKQAAERFAKMAGASGSNPKDGEGLLARRALASALQRVDVDQRWPIAEALAVDADFVASRQRALLLWYGLEPLVARDPARSVALLEHCPSSLLRKFLARRLVEADAKAGLASLVPLLAPGRPGAGPAIQRNVLDGALEALAGRKRLDAPRGWTEASEALGTRGEPEVRAKMAALGLLFGDPKAEAALRSVVADAAAPADARTFALANLVDRRTPDLAPVLLHLLDDAALQGAAVRALAAYRDPATPEALLKRYAHLRPSERDDAIATLASRPAWAFALLDGIDKGTVPRRDLNTTIARQLLAFGDAKLNTALERSWGTLRPTARDKAPLMTKYRAILTSTGLPPADVEHGRALFGRMCGQCHRLFGQGGDVGPDLTGSDRANPDYILENVLDPSATVGRDFTVTTVATQDGRLVSGLLREQTPTALVIQTPSERITLPREDVEAVKGSNTSMMPEGQLDPMTPQEIRDLFAFLASSPAAPAK